MAFNEVKMIVQLFEAPNFQGQHVELSEAIGDLRPLDFDGRAKSAKVFRGPSWTSNDELGRIVRLSSQREGTAPGFLPTIDLRPGEYPDVLSLLRSAPHGFPAAVVGSVDFPLLPDLTVTVPGETPFNRIPVVVVLYEHADFRGRKRILYADEPDLEAGTGFGNVVSSVKILAGPNFVEGLGCKLFQQIAFGGAVLPFGLSEVPRLTGFTNDEISSVQVGVNVSDININPGRPA
jgi:hypothetical protein